MCFFSKPKVDKSAQNYYAQQQASEQQRQAQIAQALQTINQSFGEEARAPIYSNVYDQALSLYTDQVQRQYEDMLAQIKVNNVRAGAGGSGGVQAFGDLQNAYQKALALAQQTATGVRENLFAQDQATKGSLIQQAHGGLGASDASNIALAALKSNENTILANARAAGLGDVFASVGTTYGAKKIGDARQQAKDDYSSYFGNSGSGYSGSLT